MITQPLKYPGGKFYLAPWIIGRFPPHIHYVEPFCGGCAVLFQKPMYGSEVINDIDGNVANFFEVLRISWDELLPMISKTEFGTSVFGGTKQILLDDNASPIVRAWAFFVINRQSRAGNGKTFTPITKTRLRGGRNNEINAWLNAIDGLPEVVERLRNVMVLNQDFGDVITSQDSPDTLFYCDPPYHPLTVAISPYRFTMSDAEHRRFLEQMRWIKGKAIISGYRCELYDSLLAHWRREDYDIANHMAGGSEKRTMTESLWMNY
jgi:DNA adenine methylase